MALKANVAARNPRSETYHWFSCVMVSIAKTVFRKYETRYPLDFAKQRRFLGNMKPDIHWTSLVADPISCLFFYATTTYELVNIGNISKQPLIKLDN